MNPRNPAVANRTRRALTILTPAIAAAALALPSPAAAATPGAWAIDARAMPTYISPSTGGNIVALITDRGAQPANGEPITITDTLPKGSSSAKHSASMNPPKRDSRANTPHPPSPARSKGRSPATARRA